MMEEFTADQFKDAARKAAQAGDVATARKLIERAKAAEASAPKPFLQTLKENVIGDNDPTTQNFGEKLGTLLNMGGESMTLGLVGDEAAAALDTAIGRPDLVTGEVKGYDDRLATYRGNEKQVRDENPWLSLGADIGGALLPGLGMAGAVAKGGSLASQAIRGMMAGAMSGGTYGFMEGEGGLNNRIMSGVKGAAIAAPIGGAAPVVGNLTGRAVDNATDWWAARQFGNAAAPQLGVSPLAARTVRDLVAMDDPAAMQAAMRRAGGDAMLADAGGTLTGALDATMTMPGAGPRIARERIDQRAADAVFGINSALDNTMGPALGVNTTQAGIREATEATRKAAYDAAYAQPINYASAQGQALLGLANRIPASAIEYANKLMRARGETSSQIMAEIADDGSVKFSRLPDVRQWDYIKQAVDALGRQGDGNGLMGGQTPLGRAYEGLARDVRNSVKGLVPEYGRALDAGADTISRVRAVEFGSTLLQPGTTREVVAETIDGMSRAEMAALRQGVRSQIDETLANVRAVASDQNIDARQAQAALAAMSSDAAKQKLRMILGDDFAALEPQIDRAAVALGLRAAVATNSKTAGRGIMGEVLNESTTPGAVRSGQPLQAGRNAWQAMTGATPEALSRLRAKTRAELADLLTRRGEGPQILRTIEDIASRTAPGTAAPQIAEMLARALGLSSATTSANRLPERLQFLPSR